MTTLGREQLLQVRSAAASVGADLGLPEGWLNDGAKGFTPGDDPDRIGVYEGSHLSVAAASPRYLLSMKLLAARVERDQDDIRTLYGLCGFTRAEEGLDLLERTYPGRVLPPRVQYLLQELFPDREPPSQQQQRGQEGPEIGR